ncbi:uncharacterized protein CDV56_107416 [Aspergillus thermomutatus]|uniref:N-acetyltransferase domain-containing protein n=1 Tax=Aspergillus thermomutatus TaxID=41047 RepID=A0A397GSB2_ASPTH|nr:uncharacterized protein CDV56_107416 [Aspergillus thermomutatus]RHZ53931.1 hypothetical protein CDV56_107416 [Aspergillus thermomutatus]
MSNIALVPREFPTEKELDKIVDRYRHLRLAGLKQDPKAFTANYETEAQFPYEKWLSRIQNPKARTFIALDQGERVNSSHDALTALLSREWLGTVTIGGPKFVSSSEIDIEAPWKVFTESDRYAAPPVDDRDAVAVYMIAGMFVLPASRGRGNGRRLVEETVKYTRGASPATERTLLVLLVEAENEAARKLYERCGFRKCSERVELSDHQTVGMILELEHNTTQSIDYMVTRYVAEFINSLTNVVYIIYAFYGLYQLRQKPNAGFLRTVPYWGLMAVGVCSAVYHVSLKYHTQMWDDLSMLFTTTPVLHRVMTADANPRVGIVTGIVLGSSLLALIIYHVKTDELLLHAVFFVGSVTTIGIYTMRLINARTLAGSEARRQIWGMVRFGAVIFNLGYWLWLVDGWVCSYLKSMRETVGLPWAFLLELHGWWHICTGIGAYIFIAVIDHLVSGEDHRNIPGSLAWPAPWAAQSVFAGRGSDEKQE